MFACMLCVHGNGITHMLSSSCGSEAYSKKTGDTTNYIVPTLT